MRAKKVKTILLIAILFIPFISTADVVVPDATLILEQHLACSLDSECILIQRHCGDCDCGRPVNSKFLDIYMEERAKRCANFSGGVCDLICPTNESVCSAGKCVVN